MEPIIIYYAKKLIPNTQEDRIMDYLNYIDTMQKHQKTNRFYTENHHIIPRFLCKDHSFLLRIRENQKVLSVEDHIRAHKKLMEIYPCLQTKTAYLMILRTCRKLNINITEESKSEEMSTREWLRENTPWRHGPSPEQKEKSRQAHIGKHIGKGSRLYHKGEVEVRADTEEEWRILEQEGWTHGRSPRIQAKVSAGVKKVCKAYKGTLLMEKDGVKQRIARNERELFRERGWHPVNAVKTSRKGTTYVTNGVKTLSVTQQELSEYLAKGWRQGLTRKNKTTSESYI
jgi:hypothetical protein